MNRRKGREEREERDRRIRELAARGEPVATIARLLNCSRQVVGRALGRTRTR